MIDGREPNYICLSTRVLNLVKMLSDLDRLSFLDGFIEGYERKLSGEASSLATDGIVGELLRQALETMGDCFDSYMKKVNANPSGRKPSDFQEATHRVPIGYPEGTHRQPKINKSNINKSNINQIKSNLIKQGYSEREIEQALSGIKNPDSIRDTEAYIKKTIENARKKQPHVTAQDYSQRDYTDEQSRIEAETEEEMQEWIKKRAEGPE